MVYVNVSVILSVCCVSNNYVTFNVKFLTACCHYVPLEDFEEGSLTCVHVILRFLRLGASNASKKTAESAVIFLAVLVQLLPDELHVKR